MENANKALIMGMLCLVMLIGAIILYFLPTIIASKRKHPNKTAITIIDIFLGWSLIGWVVALAWACSAIDRNKNIVKTDNKYDNLKKLQELKENGTITEQEFNVEKEKILK